MKLRKSNFTRFPIRTLNTIFVLSLNLNLLFKFSKKI